MTRIFLVTLLCILHHRKKLNTYLLRKIYQERLCLPCGASGSNERKHRCTRHIVEEIFCWNKNIPKNYITLHRLEIFYFHIGRQSLFIFVLQTCNDNTQHFGFRLVYMSQTRCPPLFFSYNWKCIRLFLIFNVPFFGKKLKLKHEYFCYFETDFFQVRDFQEKKKK